jgi:hypothetical protein
LLYLVKGAQFSPEAINTIRIALAANDQTGENEELLELLGED